MPLSTTPRVTQPIIALFDRFTHGGMSRKAFLQRLAQLAGGFVAAQALLPLLEMNYARAQTIDPALHGLQEGMITYPSPAGPMQAFRAEPASADTGAVVVIHENRGLNPHIKDVARRAAAAGYLAIAPDALSPSGGTPDDSDAARSALYELDYNQTVQAFVAGVDYLYAQEGITGVGCVGFCWGGAMANQLAVHSPKLKAAVAFYGRQAAAEDVPRIKAALQLHYAGLDSRINEGIPAYEQALEANGVHYELHMYPGVNHAFHNDTSATRYDEAAAKLAWSRTLAFWAKHL